VIDRHIVKRKRHNVLKLKGQRLFNPFSIAEGERYRALAELAAGDGGDNARACPIPRLFAQDVGKFRVRGKGEAERVLELGLTKAFLDDRRRDPPLFDLQSNDFHNSLQ
jgi:hypothetical protein